MRKSGEQIIIATLCLDSGFLIPIGDEVLTKSYFKN